MTKCSLRDHDVKEFKCQLMSVTTVTNDINILHAIHTDQFICPPKHFIEIAKLSLILNHREMSYLSRRGRGILVAFEGCDRSGKSTQCKMLVDYLKMTGRDVARFSFPGMSRWITQRFVILFFDFC